MTDAVRKKSGFAGLNGGSGAVLVDIWSILSIMVAWAGILEDEYLRSRLFLRAKLSPVFELSEPFLSNMSIPFSVNERFLSRSKGGLVVDGLSTKMDGGELKDCSVTENRFSALSSSGLSGFDGTTVKDALEALEKRGLEDT